MASLTKLKPFYSLCEYACIAKDKDDIDTFESVYKVTLSYTEADKVETKYLSITGEFSVLFNILYGHGVFESYYATTSHNKNTLSLQYSIDSVELVE